MAKRTKAHKARRDVYREVLTSLVERVYATVEPYVGDDGRIYLA